MASKLGASVMLPFVALLLLLSFAAAHNITEILAPFSDYSTFNDLLSETKLADEINRRQTITVLVIDNSAIGPLSSLPPDALKNALAVHILLDYYDPVNLDKLGNKTALFTTLFQTTGAATGRTGFLNYTELPDDQMVFGSAAPGAPVTSSLIKVVAARPYNISVLQIGSAIIPPGLESTRKSTTPPTNTSSPPPTAVAAPKKAPAPAPVPTPTTQPVKLASPPPTQSNDSTSTPPPVEAPKKASSPINAAAPIKSVSTPPPQTKAASPPTKAASPSDPSEKAVASPLEKVAASSPVKAANPPTTEVSAPSPTRKASSPSPITATWVNIDPPSASPPSPTIAADVSIAASPYEGSPIMMPARQHSSAGTSVARGVNLGFALTVVVLLGAM